MAGAEVEQMVFLYCTCSQQELYKEVRRLSTQMGDANGSTAPNGSTQIGHANGGLAAGLYAPSPSAPCLLPWFAVLDMYAPVARRDGWRAGLAGWHLTRCCR
jgi:hypothetical protein